MQIEVIIPFSLPHLSCFRKGEIVNMPDKEAKELIAGKLAKPAPINEPEYAVAPHQRKR